MKRTHLIALISSLFAVVVIGFALPKQWASAPAPVNTDPATVPADTINHATTTTNDTVVPSPTAATDTSEVVETGVVDAAEDDVSTDVTVVAPVEKTTPSVEPSPGAVDQDVDTPVEPIANSATATTKKSAASDTPSTSKPATQITVVLQVVGGATYTVAVPTGSTVETVMTAAAADGLQYQAKAFGGMGSYITAIDGKAEDTKNHMYWILYVNGAKSQVGMSSYTVKDGDQVQWQYERGY